MVPHVFFILQKNLSNVLLLEEVFFYFVILYFKQCFATAQAVLNLKPSGIEHARGHWYQFRH
jgi:hypothetical protein